MRSLRGGVFLSVFLSVFLAFSLCWGEAPKEWIPSLTEKIKTIDEGFSGNLGVSIKDMQSGATLSYQGDRPWYFSSTTKVFIAISLLKEVEKGRLSLQQELTLKQSDFVDGSGPLLYSKPGQKFKISYLLQQMLTQSDSTATDMLFRRVGEKQVNQVVQEFAPGFGHITSIVDVRYGAYHELHPNAKTLTNMDFVALKKVPASQRAQAFAKKLKVPPSQLRFQSIFPAFEAYYQKGSNSGSLVTYAELLAHLAEGKILNAEHTALILQHMRNIKTGEDRIKRGLKKEVWFAQKTGTQIQRMCNVGIVQNPRTKKSVSIAACLEKFTDSSAAKKVFQQVGRALTEARLI